MNNSQTAAMRPQSLPIGMLLLFGAAFALLQLSSLLLGPSPSRQFNLSLAVPTVDLEDASNSVGVQVETVVGSIIEAAAPADRQPAGRAPLTHAAAIAARPAHSSGAVKPVATVSHTDVIAVIPSAPVSAPLVTNPVTTPVVTKARGDRERKEEGKGGTSEGGPERD